jgi:hypothetical protein
MLWRKSFGLPKQETPNQRVVANYTGFQSTNGWFQINVPSSLADLVLPSPELCHIP